MDSDAFTLHLPADRTTPLVFSSPHSGADYPEAFVSQSILDRHTIRSSEDAFVDRLFSAAPAHGAPLLAARIPRAYIDLNRAADELDPAVIEGIDRAPHNPRVSSGLGVIPRVVAGGRAIYRGKLARNDAEFRILRYWHPYHSRLKTLLDESLAQFGHAILIDCHSMPHEAIEAHSRPGHPRPDVVLGDRFGAAAARDVVDRIESAFAAAGLRTARNAPFAGAYIAQAYGRPSRNQHVVQIEIDRALYMDETRIEPRADFDEFQRLMTHVIADITAPQAGSLPLAAE
ncbi:N-formylglutamate amidohydrolase [Rhodobacteraceae bacterium HSP-20]|uniref:N-formylglutamate amidohydrolase n=1 Tax=Paragemmobacter amnigenus TaxID=2852097 RepID=A0ABS6J390_9RHOB|nr:N-formylglutamate amidohydrolase [Rhodobacter amnigenus]MBU9698020.1 N-formylglutamate amidohydrolase [Rhodobacter amnigenus]MBV4389247.1 N-formylglutamate amidohydrolase [Rhodobacter amnigenus]